LEGWKGRSKRLEDWKGGRMKVICPSIHVLPTFQPYYQHSILQRQHWYIFHEIVRLDLPHFHICGE
jgi:hypothetical protein